MFKKLILATSLVLVSTSVMAWPSVGSDNGAASVIQGAKDVIGSKETQEVALFVGMASQQYYFINSYVCSNPPKKDARRGAIFSSMAWTLESSKANMEDWSPEMVIEYAFKETYGCKEK